MNIDKRALREVAEKATKGPWKVFSDIDTKTFSIHTPRDKRCENVIKWGGFDCQPNAEANAEFIAAFNPKVALALLDENIQLQREKDAIEAVALALRDDMRQAREQLAALTAEPVSQTYELPELIEGMEVSVDVSTCDFDAGHRYFGTVTEVSELDTAKNGCILLVQDAKPNFDVNGNSPVTPDGYALVPVEPTDEMIAAAMECDDVVFDSKDLTAFCVQYREIYCAMVDAAPEPETMNG
ncbi:ead/Ea22-like family protein [Salmonella enterica]|nr:ead/Ea22-like family protein [Salmonella enterica]